MNHKYISKLELINKIERFSETFFVLSIFSYKLKPMDNKKHHHRMNLQQNFRKEAIAFDST